MPPRTHMGPGRRLAAADFRLVGPAGDIARLRECLIDSGKEEADDGVPTLMLEVFDPSRKLLNSKLLATSPTLVHDGVTWQLQKVDKQGRRLRLIFEPAIGAVLRLFDEPKRWNRANVTRAQVVEQVLQEAEQANGIRIPFVCPERDVIQPIAKPEPVDG